MQLFKFLPYLLVLVAAFDPEDETVPACNNAKAVEKGPAVLSKACSDPEVNKDGWLYVTCPVGSKHMKFGAGLGYCVVNNDGKIAVQKDGGAMNSEACKKSCKAIIKKDRSATLKCDADSCKGEIDLDKAIKFTGRYLTCGGHIGSGGMDLDKYNEDKGK